MAKGLGRTQSLRWGGWSEGPSGVLLDSVKGQALFALCRDGGPKSARIPDGTEAA